MRTTKTFHEWCAERELKALDNAWECEVQDIYGRFLDSHRYTADGENEIKHKEYLDSVERTLNMELEAVNKVYEEKRKEIMTKLLENVSESDKTPSQELNIVHCPDCKYCVKTKDGEYNPDDIVCSYWSSDGLESGDFCSYGEKGEYEWCDYKDLQGVGFWQTDKVAFHKTCPFCGCHIRDDKTEVFEGDGEYNFCINCGAMLKEGEK